MDRRLIVFLALLPIGPAARAQHPWRHYADAFEIRFATTQPVLHYALRVDSADLSGWDVVMDVRNAPDTFRLAMAAHPEYDDQYWRYVTGLGIESDAGHATIARQDSAVWRVVAPGGSATVRYRILLPAPPAGPRAAWRPFLTPTGGLFGGPHAFMYVLGAELAPAHVTLELPGSWRIATGLVPTAEAHTFFAPSVDVLVDAPIFAGRFSVWRFSVAGVPHRVVYWPLPDAATFDTGAFVRGLEGVVRQAVEVFGRAPYREYTFVFQDGAYGGLEHLNSVTLGARSTDLAENPNAVLQETAHEFVHTWNLMRIRPAEYRRVDYRTQPPTAGLWFSEGLTLFYADLLLRRARLPVSDSTRIAHLERLIARYLASPGNSRYSAEAVSRVAYNAPPGSLGDYSASAHLQGELIGAMLDLVVRDATRGARSMDDVMRVLLERFAGERGFEGRDIERTVEDVCGCDVSPLFAAHVRGGGRPIDFDRYLGLVGLVARVSWAPAVWNGQPERDLRIFGWEPLGEGGVRLIITDPGSRWGQAGLHSGDRLVSMNGAAVTTWAEMRSRLVRLQMGDTLRVEVRRPSGPFQVTVRVTGFDRPQVRIEPAPHTTAPQRALAAQWLRGAPAPR
ncbi:MAG: PDZ domain-containing protein [Gemmatimonadales bacterium]